MAAAGVQGRKRLLKEEDMTKVEFETSEEVDVTPTFDTMGLREDLLRGIYAYGTIGAGLRPAVELARDANANALPLVKLVNLQEIEPLGTGLKTDEPQIFWWKEKLLICVDPLRRRVSRRNSLR